MAELPAASRLTAVGGNRTGDVAETAGLAPRLFAYLIDSVVLFGFAMVFATIGGLIIFISSDGGDHNPSDGAFTALVIAILVTVPAWVLFTVAMFWRRGQSVGQYLLGIEITREESGIVGNGQIVAYTLALHPLIFHPIAAAIWGYAAYQSVIHSSLVFLLAGLTMAALCLIAPFGSLFFALSDGQRRGIHDRIAGVRVVRVTEQG